VIEDPIRACASASLTFRTPATRSASSLAARGLIQRSPDPDDRRRNVITITPAGTKQLRALAPILDGVQDQLLAPLSAAERTQLVGLLTRLLEHDAQP
jgi:DNA-binding MarR family transcriptional regulator